MTKAMIETNFAQTLRREGIQASVTVVSTGVSICVEAEALVEKVQALMKRINTVIFSGVDFYAADDDGMPAEWYLRYNFA